MAKKKRAARRAEERALGKMSRDLGKLADLGPGGSAERAIVIASPAEVEVHARGVPCPICRAEVRVLDHTAETVGGARVRVARVECTACRKQRVIYFRLSGTLLN